MIMPEPFFYYQSCRNVSCSRRTWVSRQLLLETGRLMPWIKKIVLVICMDRDFFDVSDPL
jgi:hypothetical protein